MDLLIQEHDKHPNNLYMFPSLVTGKMYYPDSVVKLHEKILKDTGPEYIRFHGLRYPNVKFKTKNLYLLSIKLEISDFAVKWREIIERESG